MFHSSIRERESNEFYQQWQMRGKGISIGQPQPRTRSGGKTLKKCKNKGAAADNVVIIDVDSDNYNNVIIIDVPEFLPNRFRGSSSNGLRRDEKYSFTTVICIDDDDINSENTNSDEGQFVQENNFPVKLSKCKRTYSGKASTSNRYGLNTDSESGSSDDDCPDFEFEGSSGKLKEQWEKAFFKRQNDMFTRDYQAGTSRFCTDNLQDIGKEKKSDKCIDDSDSPSLSSYEEADRSPSIANDNGKSGSAHKMKNDICNGHQSDMRDSASASRSCIDSNQDVEIGNKTNENGSIEKKNDVFNSQSCLGDTGNDSVFFNREMHKETDEYKRSVEEELASRQRELQIQAEEAKQLKRSQKRKRAESMRLLDMERRQKQRVEEMRETQKKDEENLNLKEQLRAEVRKDLNRLETTCHDMASILRGLGIHVSGDSGANEVRVAFKRALLRFHPDRASQSDIRQQVEAEEKFKLISRMKDKFLSTS